MQYQTSFQRFKENTRKDSKVQKTTLNRYFKLIHRALISLTNQKRLLMVFTLSTLSRIFFLSLGYSVSKMFECFDKSRALYKTESIFSFLVSWDAFHFLDISQHGYDHEHALPFFMLYPLICKLIHKKLMTVISVCTLSFIMFGLLKSRSFSFLFYIQQLYSGFSATKVNLRTMISLSYKQDASQMYASDLKSNKFTKQAADKDINIQNRCNKSSSLKESSKPVSQPSKAKGTENLCKKVGKNDVNLPIVTTTKVQLAMLANIKRYLFQCKLFFEDMKQLMSEYTRSILSKLAIKFSYFAKDKKIFILLLACIVLFTLSFVNLKQSIDLVTASVIFNNLLFILNSLLLFKITSDLFNTKFAIISTVLFAFNPASIVFSAPYSECLFTTFFLLTISSYLRSSDLNTALLIGLGTLCRSNSIFNILFIPLKYIPIALMLISIFQIDSLLLIWQSRCTFKPLVPYSLVQKVYWAQGFLKFYTVNNIPNLLIGLPTVLTSILLLAIFIKNLNHFKKFLYNGESANQEQTIDNTSLKNTYKSLENNAENVKVEFLLCDTTLKAKKSSNLSVNILFYYLYNFLCKTLRNLKAVYLRYCNTKRNDKIIYKCAFLLAFQTFMLVFQIHMNIALRFIAFNPFIYWITAFCCIKYNDNPLCSKILTFFFVYGMLYTIMFSCFYPPA